MILIIIANCFVSTGLIMLFTRLMKNERSVSLASTFYALLNLAICLPTIIPSLSINIYLLDNLAKLSPFYWTILAIIEGNVFISFTALILIGLVFVTCGSFMLRDFAKN
jgi:ABC-2 type transport system permease protein